MKTLILMLLFTLSAETKKADPKKVERDTEQIKKMMSPPAPLKGDASGVQLESTCKEPTGKLYNSTDPGYDDCMQRRATPDARRQFTDQTTTPSIGVKVGK